MSADAAAENHEAAPSATATAPSGVEIVTEALASTSIAPKEASAADAAHAAHTASAAEGRRLYIGNLAYSTTDDQLKEFFAGFDIESTSIPTNPRSNRAVGYAFVDLTTKEEAERAIAELSGQEVLERKVSVQLARKPGTASKRERYNNNNVALAEGGQEEEDGESQQQGGGRRHGSRARGRGKGRGGRSRAGNRANGSTATGETAAEEGYIPSSNVLPLTEPANVTEVATDEAPGVSPAGPPARGENAAGGFKDRRRRGPPENGVPSTTKVMVANLPYELSEEKLKELFAEYQPESAKIALRPIPRFMVRKLLARGEPRKGRGFGFVTLASEELQQKAVEEMNGKVVDGREIAVKVAIDNPKIESENDEASEGERKAEVAGNTEDKEEVKENGFKAEATLTGEATAA
jgi:RNA recognition motif-containing protein